MFENKIIQGVHATRYYSSWCRSGGDPRNYDEFNEWLISLDLSKEERSDICHLAENGRLELETSARKWIKALKAAK